MRSAGDRKWDLTFRARMETDNGNYAANVKSREEDAFVLRAGMAPR